MRPEFEQHDWPSIEASVRRVVSGRVPRQDRDDVVQTCLANLLARLKCFQVRDVLQYAARVARSCCYRFRRAQQRSPGSADVEGVVAPCGDGETVRVCAQARDLLAWFKEHGSGRLQLTPRQEEVLKEMPGKSRHRLANTMRVDRKRIDQLAEAIVTKARFLAQTSPPLAC